ncbi:TIGR04283 family arsenosugar biosynthesis glycosyltransferase [Alphaproteobacteria bacterium]|nr:TIGR04283 family arsenosugar biosynthesis glycosyltransferase [Alphaproteobacteria bacterium]
MQYSIENNITIIIPTYQAGLVLKNCLESIGNKFHVLIIDGNSDDNTLEIARKKGASVFQSPILGRGSQLSYGASLTNSDWLLFLHADSVLDHKWEDEVKEFIITKNSENIAGVFKLKFNSNKIMSKVLEFSVYLRNKFFNLPYGDQGLLISNYLYNKIGGFSDRPIMEDLELIERLGKKNIFFLNSFITTSYSKYKQDGYLLRVVKNLICLVSYKLNLPIKYIHWLYGK